MSNTEKTVIGSLRLTFEPGAGKTSIVPVIDGETIDALPVGQGKGYLITVKPAVKVPPVTDEDKATEDAKKTLIWAVFAPDGQPYTLVRFNGDGDFDYSVQGDIDPVNDAKGEGKTLTFRAYGRFTFGNVTWEASEMTAKDAASFFAVWKLNPPPAAEPPSEDPPTEAAAA